MYVPRTASSFALILALACFSSAARAQSEEPAEPAAAAETVTADSPVSAGDRLFLSFAQDAAIADRQWWEGQFEYADGIQDEVDWMVFRGIVAIQPWKRVEMGLRFGFADSSTPGGVADGSGATDLDVWGKYYLDPGEGPSSFAFGGLLTIPTGDDAEGLGTDSFSLQGFGAMRYKLKRSALSFQAGLRYNANGEVLGVDLDGKASVLFGAAWIRPLSQKTTLVVEARFESERFDGMDTDGRILGGINWRAFKSGMVRTAVSFGLSDGAPNAEVFAGVAFTF